MTMTNGVRLAECGMRLAGCDVRDMTYEGGRHERGRDQERQRREGGYQGRSAACDSPAQGRYVSQGGSLQISER